MTDDANTGLRAPLTIYLEGPAVRRHRIALHDLVLFCRQLQTAMDRVGQVLLNESDSSRRGRKPAEVRGRCSLDLVEIRGGSLTLACDLPAQNQLSMFDDLGEKALTHLVQGIAAIGGADPALPKGYDKGVLLALREAGTLFDHGIEKISFDLRLSSGKWLTSYTHAIHSRVVARIQQPVENRRIIEGRLLMGDFKETNLRCRIDPAVGRSISCKFDEAQKEAVLAALTHYVRLTGESVENDGDIQVLRIQDIEMLDRELETGMEGETALFSFDLQSNLQELALQQGVSPVTNFEDLLGDFWPAEESADEFIATVRRWRLEEDE
ncbi:MAG: hypothetical protein M1358_15790 [Chloroflexi bacterium]|nr:hypothetical protein [Chloroflexota bacterium]